MSTSKKKGLGRGLRALFGDQTKETEKKEKPNADKSPTTKPNKVPICRLLKAIKIMPMAATKIAIKVVFETFSLRKT